MVNELSEKFIDPFKTAKGEERAYVELINLTTLWFNTGSICNLACLNCYIESNPKNDRLSFITESDVLPYLAEIKDNNLPTTLIGLTGGEPFANPHIIKIIESILDNGFEVLVLTNAYKILSRHQENLLRLNEKYAHQLKLRVSLDHYTKEVHEAERGQDTFIETMDNISWLVKNQFSVSVAGRSLIKESLDQALKGFQGLMLVNDIALTLKSGENLVIFPEMDKQHNVPEISTNCWGLLDKRPIDQMCASERMIVKKKGESKTVVMPCTLLAYDEQFELGDNLLSAKKRVFLNHPFCAEFCVLGGASCSPQK